MEENGTIVTEDGQNEPTANETASYPRLQEIEDRTDIPNVNTEERSPGGSSTFSSTVPLSWFNFWDVNGFKQTVKRIDDGARLCDDFLRLLSERAEIEGLYATKLQGWSKKWNELVNKGPEYASLKSAWLNVTNEADQLAEIHSELQIRLCNQVHGNLQKWKSTNYHKSLLSWKETKSAEEGFMKAQKPWAKRHDEVLKCKRAYYQACKVRDQAERLYKEASVEGSTINEEQVKKLKDKSDKAGNDAQVMKDKYQESLRDIGTYNPKYEEDMRHVFKKCQESEEERKTFFRGTLLNYCQQMSLVPHFSRISGIYSDLKAVFEAADVPADISWWAINYGTEMPLTWPKFEEYSGQLEQPQQQQTGVTQENSSQSDPGSPVDKKSSVCATL
ncbi:protein kinase C and casein kinase substrate in neurons protein 2-like [Montipora capricornis]|uniref:protein kinase C and casein kinase substrate in neurons protein 2-like n=1 Tax=Montipora capricornis TaxID=246305 RepID=UPI0035F1C84D